METTRTLDHFADEPVPELDLSNFEMPGTHWTDTKFSSYVLSDALIKHALGLVAYGMTDVGEVLEVVGWLKDNDEENWLNAWGVMAQRLQRKAIAADKAGNEISASTAYLRASTYWRLALIGFGKGGDPRIKEYGKASIGCYDRYLELSDYPGIPVSIPYEGTTLPGYYYRSPNANGKAPLLIMNPGKDTWGDDTRWVYDGALKRGINALSFDGPGQGFALRIQDLTYRPDWENVIGPVIDFAQGLPGVDPERIALMGMSFGGYLTGRAASFEHRIKLLVCDSGNLRWGEDVRRQHFEDFVDAPADQLPPPVRNLTRDYAYKFGIENTVKAVLDNMALYDNTDNAKNISCHTIALDGAAEVFTGSKEFLSALTCTTDYLYFDENSTAQQHGQTGGYAPATEDLFDLICKRI